MTPLARLAASASLGLLALVIFPRQASACGAAYPGGPVMCDYPPRPGAEETEKPFLRLSTSYAYTSTTIKFGGDKRADLTRHAVFGSMEVPLTARWTLQAGAGGILGGSLDHGVHDRMGPGFSAYVGTAYRLVDGRGYAPFVQLTGALSGTHVSTHTADDASPRFTAFDLRIGAIAGKTIAESFTPYVVGRAFGGPVYWQFDHQGVTGTDTYHYQVGGGVSLAVFHRRFDVFAEGIPLGEKGVSAGLGTTFF